MLTTVTRTQKIYFAAVGLLALWVGTWGYFIPTHVDSAIPWLVPPLHARFLGAMYLSGATFMLGCILARSYTEVQAVVPMIAIWTGMLFVVSLFYLDQFDYSRVQVWIWFGAYLVYPLIALWLTWTHRNLKDEPVGPRIWIGVRAYLVAQGLVFSLLSLALLLAPTFMTTLWPWKITPLLAQLYSAPFLSYGIGSLLLSRRRTWHEVWVALAATFVFTFGVLLASLLHLALFTVTSISAWLWFGGFVFVTAMLGLLSIRALWAKGLAMIKQPARLYTAIVGGFLLLQGVSTLIFRLYPPLDQAFPALLAVTQMVPAHSILHIVTGLLALGVLFWGGERGAFWFALGFGIFYIGLAFAGMLSGHQMGLGLQPFDHPFHILVGGLGLLAVGIGLYQNRKQKKVAA